MQELLLVSPPGLRLCLASPWGQHSSLRGDLTPGSISCPQDCVSTQHLALENGGEGGLFKINKIQGGSRGFLLL